MKAKDLYNLIKSTSYNTTPEFLDWQIVNIDDYSILLFQQTSQKIDWKTNLDFLPKKYNDMYLHRGYIKNYTPAAEMILETYLKQLGNKKPIFSGWSLGASPAILAAYDFYLKTNIKPQVITFGGLKIAYRKKDAEKLKSRLLITEYTQANDSITWLLPFCHRIRKAQIGEKFNLKKAFNTEFYHCNYDKFLE